MARRQGDPEPDSDARLALVLSGGGSKGAVQAGLYRALCELGVRPDFLVGASVGALNGAFVGAGTGPRALGEGWAELSRSDLFGLNWSILWKGLNASSIFSGARLRRFLEERLPVHRFEALEIPLHVVSTHLSLGEACRLSEGSVVEAVLASCSLPGLLPPVRMHDGIPHIDGSLGDNLPVRIARELGADRVVAMNCRTCDRCDPGDVSLTGVMGRAFGIAADCTLRREAERYREDPDVLLLQPDIGEHIYALDFSQGARLVQAGYEHSLPRLEEWLSAGPSANREG